MNDKYELNRTLRDLAESAPREAGESVEARLLAEFRSYHRRKTRRWIYLAQAAALLAVALVISLIASYNGSRNQDVQSEAPNVNRPFQDFLPLPYSESGVPLGNGVVMRVQLPVSELNTLGVPVPPGQGQRRIRADLLIGQDGVARAVRFVQ
jgi:hypothetical protein